jgi:membrane fusion protein (multidrug efflux system)
MFHYLNVVQMKSRIVVAGILALLFVTACSSSKKDLTNNDQFPVISPVVMDTAYSNDYVANIHSRQNVELRARIRGYVDKIHVDEGSVVKKGQLLFSISSQEYREQLLKSKAMLKSAIADAKAAEYDVHNVRLLVDKNVVSKSELDIAQAKLDALNAKIDEARSNEANAYLHLSYTEIRAPFDGVLDRIMNKPGSLIDEGTLLTTISDNSEVFAYFNVSEREYLDFADDVKANKEKDLTLILANNEVHKFKGTIEIIEGEFDKGTGSIAFRARFANPDHILKQGATGKVRMNREVKNAMVIPQKATFEIQDKMYVYVVDENNVVRTRAIVSKLRIPHLFVVESGLKENDRIIYEGIQNLKEGMKINVSSISSEKIISGLALLDAK